MSVADDFEHQPVMRDEIVDVFSTVPPGVVLDATLGGGGHTEAILESRADLRVLGIDRDHTALKAAGARRRCPESSTRPRWAPGLDTQHDTLLLAGSPSH